MDREELTNRLFTLAEESKPHGPASAILQTLISALVVGRERDMLECINAHFTPQFRASLMNQLALERRAHLSVVHNG